MNVLKLEDGSEIALPAKALSLTQPWATLVAVGAKRFETRSWKTPFRGPLVIHAARSFPAWARETCLDGPHAEYYRNALSEAGYGSVHELPTGKIVGAVILADIHPAREWATAGGLGVPEYYFGNFAPRRWAWELKNPRAIEKPFPFALGHLCIWNLRPDNCAISEGSRRS